LGSDVGGQKLETAVLALPFQPESKLRIEERQARKSRLLLLRGLQIFLDSATFRSHLVAAKGLDIGEVAASVASASAKTEPAVAPEVTGVDQPPSPSQSAAAAALSPRTRTYAPPRRSQREEPSTPSSAAQQVPEHTPEQVPEQVPAPAPVQPGQSDVGVGRSSDEVVCEEPAGLAPASAVALAAAAAAAPREFVPLDASPTCTRPGTAESWTRPTTPSWLLPPWPRPDTPSAASWTRPGTPSTVCDDAELAALPRFKFVDGQRVSLRPTAAAGGRLPPLPAVR